MSRVALLQQQSTPLLRELAPTPLFDPWQWWTPEQIARATNCPLNAVLEDWPLIYTALAVEGIADFETCRVALATIAIETAHTFKPVTEAFWLDDVWRWANLRYAPYWGRGYIQLTWLSNYQYYGMRIGHTGLVDTPDMAKQPVYAAQILAAFFFDHDIHIAARAHDWRECRRRVQGAYAGINEFIAVIDALGAAA